MTYIPGGLHDGDNEGYSDRAWAKVPNEHFKYRQGERYAMCKECDTACYATPDAEGKVSCWNCQADIVPQILWGLGRPAP
jgi:hypothetical protein